MGIESDKLVFDYLSRIGDLAHSTPMTAAERARLVSGLRGEIDRMRAEQGGAESKAAVKKILGRLGPPEDVVAARGTSAGGGSYGSYGTDEGGADGRDRTGDSRRISLDKSGDGSFRPSATASYGASAPHLAGRDELGPEESDPDWWRVDTSPYGDGGTAKTFGDPVPGFIGGIELPELFNPPGDEEKDGTRPAPGPAGGAAGGAGIEAEPGAAEPGAVPAKGIRKIFVPAARKPPEAVAPAAKAAAADDAGASAPGGLRRLWPARPRLAAAGPRAGGVVELAAAALLVTGAAIGSLIPLGVGWLAAWWSPRLSRTEAKWAAAGMPGLVAIGTAVWLWGRSDGRWGEPLAQGGEALGQALTEVWPVLLRVAAVASALFLLWRARRPRA